MKEMKKSLKFVLISLCAVVVLAAAVVSTILLVRKTNEPKPDERFTAKQQILLSDISQANGVKKTENSKNLVEITSVRGENNEELSQDEIYGYFNGYFVALDEYGNKILYAQRGNKNVNILRKLLNEQKLKVGALNLSAEKVNDNYLLYSYEYTENEKTFKAYEIVDFSNLDKLTILNKIAFEMRDDKLYVGENQIKNLEINLLDGYFEVCYKEVQTSTAYANEIIDSEKYLKNFYVYGDSDLKQTIEYANSAESSISETASDNGFVIVKLSQDKAQFIYKTTNANGSETFKTYDYEIDGAKNYIFYATNDGVFIEIRSQVDVQDIYNAVMIDGKLYKYSYEFFNLKTGAVEEFNLSTGMVRASFASQGEFLIVFEQPRDYLSVSEWGTLCYYDLNDELVLNYSATSIDSTIKYSNNGRFLTVDGIYVCKNETNAQLAFAFKTQQKDYVILSENIDSDWFVVRDEVTKASYIMSIKGEIAFNELFVSIVDFGEGYFLTSKNGKRHLCVPSENQKTLLENYTSFYEIYLPEFGMYLSEDGENLYTLFNYKNEVVESGVELEVVARENYIALITTKNNASKMYCLVLGENLGDNANYFVSANANNQESSLININEVTQIGDGSYQEYYESSLNMDEFATAPYEANDGCMHNNVTYFTKEATCTEEGQSGFICDDCGYTYIMYTTPEKHTGTYNDEDASIDGDIIYADGEKTISCVATKLNDENFTENSNNEIIAYKYPKTVVVSLKEYSYYADCFTASSHMRKCDICGEQNGNCTDIWGYANQQSVTSVTYRFDAAYDESSGEVKYIPANGALGTLTATPSNRKNVGDYYTLTLKYESDYNEYRYCASVDGKEVNSEEDGNIFSKMETSGEYYCQPQEKLTYSVTFHQDTPYWYNSSYDHYSGSSTSTSAERDKFTSNIPYFAWSDLRYSVNIKDKPKDVIQNGKTFYKDLSASHYEFIGWKIGNKCNYNSVYLLNTGDEAQETFDGYAFGLGWNTTKSFYLQPIWEGNSINIIFIHSNPDIYVRESKDDTTYEWKSLNNADKLGNGDNLQVDNCIDVNSNFIKDSKDASSDDLKYFTNVAPADLHSKIIEQAEKINNPNDVVLELRNYIHEGWVVCNTSGVIISYTDYTEYSDTFLSYADDVVYVMACYRLKSYKTDVVGTESSESSWRGFSTTLNGDVGDSINEVAVAYVDDDETNKGETITSTVQWSKNGSSWTTMTNLNSPSFSETTGWLYFKISINIKSPQTVTDPKIVAQFYRFTTITFSNYYNGLGTSESYIFEYNFQQKELNSDGTNLTWKKTSGPESGGISWYSDYNSTSNPSSAVVVFKVFTYGSWNPLIDSLFNIDEKGCTITIGELAPIYDQTSDKTTIDGENADFVGEYDGYNVYDVHATTSSSALIISSSGNNANYYEPEFETIDDVKVDTNNKFNDTHMMVVEPKTKYVYSLDTNGSSESSSRKIITNYISLIEATIKRCLSLTSSKTELEDTNLNTETIVIDNLSNILEYHDLTYSIKTADGNKISYNNKSYKLVRVNGYSLFDIYIGIADNNSGQSPYEDYYAYFIFYNGQVNFNFIMTDINFGEIDVDDSTTGEYSEDDNAETGRYQYFSNYADWLLGTKNSNSNVTFAKVEKNGLAITDFSALSIKPNAGFLIEEIKVTLTPKNGEFVTPLTRTYTLDYANNDKAAVVTLNGNNFDVLRYKYEDSEIIFEGETVTIADLVHLQMAAPGYTDGGGWQATDPDSDGTIWLGMSKVIDSISISYKVVSYLDVLFKQFKNIDIYSYLKNNNLSTNTFDEANYQSDFDTKTGTWFNDTILTQICIFSVDETILDVPNPADLRHSDNYYYQTRLYRASDFNLLRLEYNKITGYNLNGNSYFSINGTFIGRFKDLIGPNYDFANNAVSSLSLKTLRNAAIDVVGNIDKEALRENVIEAKYYSDPVAYKLKYGTKTETLYYDQEYTLDSYENVSATGYKEKEGYSFIGWVSNGNYSVVGGTDENRKMTYDTNYGYLFTCEDALAGLIGSSWYFGRNAKGVALYSNDKDGNIVNSQNVYSDFYVDGARFISDTGYYKNGQGENYNFLCVGQKLNAFKNDGSGEYQLYPVWMANDYTLKFSLNDIMDVDDGSKGSTETLFRINNTAFSYLNSYTDILNNGFNFKLTYDGTIDNNLKLQAVDGVINAANAHDFYVYVRYDTKEWYFSNADGSRLIYYQDFFIDGITGQVNADRYGYTFAHWLMKNNDPFTEAQLFDSEFYNNCEIVEIDKFYYSYKNNPYKSISSTTKEAYTYGNNGELFDITKRETNSAGYNGCKVVHFITNRLPHGEFRTAEIKAEWTINKYYIRVQKYGTYDFEFVDGTNYEINNLPFSLNDYGNYYLSTSSYVFDSNDYSKAQKNICDYLLQIPYRHGYDFAGWTFAYDKMDNNNINDIAQFNTKYENYWYEQLIYKEGSSSIRQYQGLCDDLLRYYNYYKADINTQVLNNKITNILFYNNGTNDYAELLGDLDTGKAHYVNFYANWTPMLYSVEVDLNIPGGYEDISNELFVGLFEPELQADGSYKHVLDEEGYFANGIMQDGFRVDENGIASFNYMKDNKTYKASISNTSFKIYYGMTMGEAYLELVFKITDEDGNVLSEEEPVKFGIADLYIKLNNNNFLGWDLSGYDIDLDLEKQYLEYYADNFREVSSYGDVLVYENGAEVRRAILRDVVVEDNNIDGEEVVTERLYVESLGERYYLSALDHLDENDNKNENWNFSDEYLMIVVDGKEYFLYEDLNNGFYVIDAFKDEFDQDGNIIEKDPVPTTNIFEISSTQNNSILTGINSSIIKEFKIRKYRKFEIEATWSEINVNSIDYDLNVENANNSSTGKINYMGSLYNVYYKEVLDIDTGEVSKDLIIQILNSYGKYDEKLVTFYYDNTELGFNDKYLTYNGFDILINAEGKPYYNFVEANGTVTPKLLDDRLFNCFVDNHSEAMFDISQMHDFLGYNQYANPGLTGIYSIKTDSKAEVKTNSEIIDNGDGTFTQNGLDDFQLSTTFEYNENAEVEVMPYYNGRYLTEISFEFKHIFEDETIRKSFTDVGLANYVDVRLVFDLFWDSENRTIGIEKVELYRRDQNKVLWTIERKEELRGYTVEKDAEGNIVSIKFKDFTDTKNPINTNFGYYDWWRTEDAIDTENSKRYDKLLDFIDSYFGFMLPEDGAVSFDEFISIGRYIDIEEEQERVEGREDVNVVSLTLKQLKKPLTLAMKFSVQTFDVNVYSVLNDNYDKALKTEGVIESPYLTLEDLEKDIDYTTSMLSKDYGFNVDDEEYPKFATIISDSDGSGERDIIEEELEKNQIIAEGGEIPIVDDILERAKTSVYNVPYGYFAYGYNLDTNYIGYRPIDKEENKTRILNPFYGLSYIYLNSLYYYKDSNLLFTTENSDLINSKALKETQQKPTYDGDNLYLGFNSPMIGDPEKFLQSVRADKELIYYNFGGLFFIDNKETVSADGRVYFRGVSEDDENSYINKNYHIYAYYYIRTTATEAGFYAWDDVTSSYQKIEDINDGYAYYKLDKDEYYTLDGNNTLIQVDGKPTGNVLYTFKEVGIDTEKFAGDFNYIPDFGDDEGLKNEYLEYLKLVSETYWFICNDGTALLNGIEDLSGLKYDEKSKLYYDEAGDKYYALVQQRNMDKTYYGATLYKKVGTSQTINKIEYDLYEKVENVNAFDPEVDEVTDYVVFKDYYVLYNGEYYKISPYSVNTLGTTYYSPLVEYYIDSAGVHYGNSVTLPTGENGKEITYYFNYKTQKLYQPNQLGVEVEVADFSYQIKSPVNDNYDVSVIERTTGFGLYGISLVTIPDSSVSYWMPDREFLFWAAITQEELNSLLQYEADTTSESGKVYTTLLNQFKQLNPTEAQLKAFMDELNEKLKRYTFKDLISAGVLVKQFYYNNDTHAVERVELEFVVDLGEFNSLAAFVAAYPDRRMPINVSADFDILEAGSAMVSSLYGIQVYKRVNFKINNYFVVDADVIDKDYFELYGDSIYYYTEKFGDFVRFAELSYTEHCDMIQATDKAAMLDYIIKSNAASGNDIVIDLNEYVTRTEKVDENGDFVFDQYGNLEYDYNYDIVNSSSYLYAFYYKANMPEGSEPYVVAVAKF